MVKLEVSVDKNSSEQSRKTSERVKQESLAQKIIVLNVTEYLMLRILNYISLRKIWKKFTSVYEEKTEIGKHALQPRWFCIAM